MRYMVPPFVLSSAVHYSELLERVDIVNDIDWICSTVEKDRRVSRIQHGSPGRSASGGDFVWCYPYLKFFLVAKIALIRATLPRRRAEDLSTGLLYVPEGSVAQRIASKNVAIEVPLISPVVPDVRMANFIVPAVIIEI